MKLKFTIIASIAVLLPSISFAEISINTFPSWDGTTSVGSFGEPNTATYGQTFLAPATDPVMTSFTFVMNDFLNSDFVDFEAHVYAWDGTKATGAALFSSGTLVSTNNAGTDGFEYITVNTGSLALVPNSSYVAFFSASNYFDSIDGTSSWGLLTSDEYPDGGFVYSNNGSDFGQLTTNDWSTFGGTDLAFRIGAVPELSTVGLLGLAFAGLSLSRRRK
ncbi:MAG: PEP-CTERM sorting domain-containing protein [Verrucomicrobiae bacterium]|nr:PEP-CTERM sorting domain-containing protein [Verrucomicrobiae bacterium]